MAPMCFTSILCLFIHFIANINLEHSRNIFSSQLHSSSSKLCNCS